MFSKTNFNVIIIPVGVKPKYDESKQKIINCFLLAYASAGIPAYSRRRLSDAVGEASCG